MNLTVIERAHETQPDHICCLMQLFYFLQIFDVFTELFENDTKLNMNTTS